MHRLSRPDGDGTAARVENRHNSHDAVRYAAARARTDSRAARVVEAAGVAGRVALPLPSLGATFVQVVVDGQVGPERRHRPQTGNGEFVVLRAQRAVPGGDAGQIDGSA